MGASRACSRPSDFRRAGSFRQLRVRELLRDLLRPGERLAESGVHGSGLRDGFAGDRGILATEPIDAARGIHQTLLAGEVRMALRADFHADRRRGAAGLEGVATLAVGGDRLVHRVQIGLHSILSRRPWSTNRIHDSLLI